MENTFTPEFQPLVLVVEDNMSNLQLIGSILREKNYKIGIATSGIEALKLIEKRKPDLILLDVMMPQMDGYEVCERLKANDETKEIPVIFLTARTEEQDIVRGFNLGAVDYIAKPFKKQEILSRIKTHLDLKLTRDLVLTKNNDLFDLNAKLKDVLDQKDKFFSIIAHDLRNPFSALIGLSEMIIEMKDELDDEKKLQYIEDIRQVSLNTHELLENLLSWSRAQIGTLRVMKRTIDLRALVNEAIMVLMPNIKKKKLVISSKVTGDAFVEADPDMMRTVLRNLITNAVKFTHAGGSIQISSEKRDNNIYLNISDTGIGISPAVIGTLFRIDSGFSSPGTENEAGTGLGLILCKDFIERNNGNITVQSEVNTGTTFTVTLPCPAENKDLEVIEDYANLVFPNENLLDRAILENFISSCRTGDINEFNNALNTLLNNSENFEVFISFIRKFYKQFNFDTIAIACKSILARRDS